MSLRADRQALLDRPELRGHAFCRPYADAADRWLTGLFEEASGGDDRGLALVAVGGYGRQELCPHSDLDVVLIHRGRRDVAETADRIWYPVWDEGVSLDHSVRQPKEMLDMAAEDLKVALGLLDGRVVCGDAKIAEPVLHAAAERWEKQKPAWLGALADSVAERQRSHGDVGFLLEPDLKEAHGGLRDVAALRTLVGAVPLLADYVDTRAVIDAGVVLTDVRVELHRRAGRDQNRLLLQEQDQMAEALGQPDTDTLLRRVATVGRTIAWEEDDAWRRRSAWSSGGGRRRGGRRRPADDATGSPVPGHPSVAVTEDEVVLTADADLAGDPALALELAVVAAQHRLPISRTALNLLARKAPAPPEPWPETLRQTLVDLLATGTAAVPAIEALDQRRLFERYLPEWESVRHKPQRNPYHLFTVDRHLLEATANAAALAHRVSRQDLLLIGTLLHDIGKGYPGDHTEVGMEVAPTIARRMGYGDGDVAAIVTMIKLHLLLPETATRRDLDDPATAQRVAEAVGNRLTLDLLAAMVEADSLATGPSAWNSWKAGLVADLVERTTKLLAGEPVPEPLPWLTDELRVIMDSVRERGVPALSIEDPVVTVVAPDRSGLLAEVTGVLTLHGLDVRSAAIAGEDGVAVERFVVEPSRGRWPAAARLSDDLDAMTKGALAIDEALADRARTYRPRHASTPGLVATEIMVDNHASAAATVIEVRAEDVVGQLHRITRALADCGLDVISAKVSTFGSAVVDAFYVRGPDGAKVGDRDTVARLEEAISGREGSAATA